jgi:hypothetical protein
MEVHLADDPIIGLFPLAPFAQAATHHAQTPSHAPPGRGIGQ